MSEPGDRDTVPAWSDGPGVLRDERRRIATWVGSVGLATTIVTTTTALLLGDRSVPASTVLALAALTVPSAAAVLWAARRGPDRLVAWSLRALLVVALVAVLTGTALTPQDDMLGLAFLGFLHLLASVALPPREGLVVLVVGTVAGGATVLAAGTAVGTWPLVASAATGVLAHAASRVHHRTLAELAEQRSTAMSASAALRAVVDGAGAATSGDLDEVLHAVTVATRQLGCQMSAIARVTPTGGLDAAAASGLPLEEARSIFASGEGLAARVVAGGTTTVVGDYGRWDERIPRERFDAVDAAMGAPVRVRGELWGALVAARTNRVPIDRASVDALELLAAHAGRAIALADAIGEDRSRLRDLERLHGLQDDFVSTISHELRTPLTIIDGAAETLVERGAQLPEAVREDLLRRIADHAHGLDGVIRSILDLARLDRGLVQFAPESVDLGPLVDDALRRAGPLLAHHEVVARTGPCRVLGDADLLQRAVDNLLVNAARHTPPGTRVEVTVTCDGTGGTVTVADDGPGIPAVDLAHVTERFRRVGPVTRRSGRGLGIGLALVDQVLRLHGTRLGVSSTPGEGATFAFRLPRTTDENTGTMTPAPLRSPA